MQRFARIAGGVVAEIIELPDEVALADAFHPEIAAACTACDDDVEPGWVPSDEGFSQPVATLPSHERLLAYAADRRWRKEVGGIEVGGAMVATDRDSQGMIGRAYSLALVDPDEPVDYKADSGWIEMDSETLVAIAVAVGRHVRGCFRIERSVADQIAAGAITTTAEIDAAFA